MSMQSFIGILSLVATLSACRSSTEAQAETSIAASLTMLYAPAGPLSGNPNLFEFVIQGNNTVPILSSGNLPDVTELIRLDNLPQLDEARISGGLYRNIIKPESKTHTCQSEESFSLISGKTHSVALTCYPVNNSAAADGVDVFFKVASADISVEEGPVGDLITDRDWSAPAQFSHFDRVSRKITWQTTAKGTYFHVGGQLSYFAAASPTKSGASLLYAMIFEGETLDLQAVGGSNIISSPEDASLYVTGAPSFFEENGALKMLLPIHLENRSATVRVVGNLLEEVADSEFTVVSYNVENLFDEVDDERNQGYGDYRITPNDRGFYSNWGELQTINGVEKSFSDIKIDNVIRVLQSIDANGPAVVGLQEIESKVALDRLFDRAQHLGYVAAQFSEWSSDETPNAVGLGVLSKFPIKSWDLIAVNHPESAGQDGLPLEPMRRILKVVLDVMGHDLVVYNNHWKSKGGPESWRMESAKALQADIDADAAVNKSVDYIILGDFNSNYNEIVSLEPRHNDTDGLTGINTILRAAGNELNTLQRRDNSKYNLHYERPISERKTAWHLGFGWSSMDSIIIGPGMYDALGVTYVDNSFQSAHAGLPLLQFLFNQDGTTKRWMSIRDGNMTRHEVGGYSDHAPLSARFEIRRLQSEKPIWLNKPSKPDAGDIPLQ